MKKTTKALAILLTLVLMLGCFAACTPAVNESSNSTSSTAPKEDPKPSESKPADSKPNNVENPENAFHGTTYAFFSYTEDDVAIDDFYLPTEKYIFETATTGIYTNGDASLPIEYEVKDNILSISVIYPEGDPVTTDFEIVDDTIVFTELLPDFDDAGNVIEGKDIVCVLTYKKQ